MNVIIVQPNKTASAIMALLLTFSFDLISASTDSATAHVGAGDDNVADVLVAVAVGADTDAVMNTVVVPLHIGSPAPI